ncbi:MAG: rhomboid family intramembrane serine protease [Pirellulales bacterium]
MGIYDREYYQGDQPPGLNLGGPRKMVTNLVIINAVVFLVDIILFRPNYGLSRFLSLQYGLFVDHWKVWESLTYGFAHSPNKPLHILFNMFVLWFFGREIEDMLGRSKFLMFYLTAIVISGLIGNFSELLVGGGYVLGASGAVVAVMLLFIIHFPRRTLLVWGVLPMPAWVLGALCIAMDVIEGFNPDSHVANTVHLGGAAYAFVFYKTRWSFGSLLPGNFSLKALKPRPRVRIHDPNADDAQLEAEMDRILTKISIRGEESLSRKERRTLARASRHFKQRQQ